MFGLKDYQARRAVLEMWYDRVLDAGNLIQVDEDAFREAKENLRTDRFIVAVCGQMNSGKSTLLNALLFGDEVLPSAASTTTAKITLMEGSADDSVEAILYTPDEFRRVVDASKTNPQAAAELSEARESARAAGLQESQLLTDRAQVERRAGLDDLSLFGAVSGKGGTYNVYVKSVCVRADRPWLHEVTVADTPGTNDPNPERDRVTREWIERADAVVYVTFAGQAGMDNEDVKFIDEHLAHVSPAHRIIVVNKCDDEPNTEAIWRHIRRIRDSGDLRMKSLFGDEDRIVLVSGLGALIATMQDAGREMPNEDMRWYEQTMSDKGYLDAERHGVEKLRDIIERSIIDNRGEGIIRSHQSRIANVFEEATRRLARDDDDLHHKLDAVTASSDERAKVRERLSGDILALTDHVQEMRNDMVKDLDRLHSSLDERLVEVGENVSRNVQEALRSTTDVKGLTEQAHWGIQDALYKERSTMAEHVRVLVEGIETKLNQAESELSDRIMRSGFGHRVVRTHLLPVSARSICKDAEAELVARLDREVIDNVVTRATNWWQRIFNRAKAKRRAIERLGPELAKGLRHALSVIPGETQRMLKELVDNAVRSMEESCRKSLERRRDQLEGLENEDASDEELRERINQEIADVSERARQVTALQEEYEVALAA